jgi:hypothetical protein
MSEEEERGDQRGEADPRAIDVVAQRILDRVVAGHEAVDGVGDRPVHRRHGRAAA